MVDYGYTKTVDGSFDDVVNRVIALLEEENFGIITEIDVRETFKKKLDVDYKNYRILGACNPDHAHTALGIEEEIGLLLPCNVLVYDDEDGVTVATMKPTEVIGMAGDDRLDEVASDVETSMVSMLETL